MAKRDRTISPLTTVDLETLEPHIIANYTSIRLPMVTVVYDEYLLSYSRESVVQMFPMHFVELFKKECGSNVSNAL